MKVRSSHRFIWLELAALLTLLALATLWVATPRSLAQQDNRQLKREQTQSDGATQRRIALVIGNGAYKTVPPLKNPPNDALLLAATLRKLGFEVTAGTDRSQREMKQLIREFGQRLRGGGGVGLFYFAGHGVQARGHNYLIPVDADIQTEADLEDVAVDVNYVLNMMDDAQNALNIAILDACRNNPFARSFRSAQEGLAQVKAPTGTLIAYATSPDSVAADGGGANSPYAEELTRQIQTPGVLLETMFRRVTEQVSSRSGGRQEPWYSANVKGDFYFSARPTNLSSSNSSDTTQPAKIDSVAVEREIWETIRSSNDPQDYKDYLQAYPTGVYAVAARAKVKQLETAKKVRDNPGIAGSANSETNIVSDQPGHAFRVTNYRIEAQLIPKLHMLRAGADVTFTPLDATRSVVFQFNGSLQMESIECDNERLTNFTQDAELVNAFGGNLRVDLGKVVPAGQPVTLRLRWSGVLTSPEGAPLATRRLAYVGTEGSYLPYASRWFPSHSSDLATSDITILVPPGVQVAGSSDETFTMPPPGKDGNVRFRFVQRKPALIGSISAGEYAIP